MGFCVSRIEITQNMLLRHHNEIQSVSFIALCAKLGV